MMDADGEEVFDPGDAGNGSEWTVRRSMRKRDKWDRRNGGNVQRRPYDGESAKHGVKKHYGKNIRERGGFVPGPGMTYLSNVEMSCESMVQLAAIAKEDGISVFQSARNAIEEYIKRRTPETRSPSGAETPPEPPADTAPCES